MRGIINAPAFRPFIYEAPVIARSRSLRRRRGDLLLFRSCFAVAPEVLLVIIFLLFSPSPQHPNFPLIPNKVPVRCTFMFLLIVNMLLWCFAHGILHCVQDDTWITISPTLLHSFTFSLLHPITATSQ